MEPCSIVSSQPPLWVVRTQWQRKGDALGPQAVTWEDASRVRNNQGGLIVVFWNEGDRVLLLLEKNVDVESHEVAFGNCLSPDADECVWNTC